MRTKLISKSCDPSPDFGAGTGYFKRYEYLCPCGKGLIVETHDDVPGFREHDVLIHCTECNEKYKIDDSKGISNWEIVEK